MRNKMKYFLFFLIAIILSCSKKQLQKDTVSYVFDEKFVDSTNIGLKGFSKVEIEKFHRNNDDDFFVILNFYKKDSIWNYNKQKSEGFRWIRTDRFYFADYSAIGIDAQLQDFNNDTFKDLTYESGIAARGGNMIRTLFIFNPKTKHFTHIRNSDNYPNLSYNPKLNCINSIILTGSTSTYFLKIQKDTLFDFARIDVSDTILVEERDAKGKYQLIEKKKFIGNDEDFYSGYSTYKPLKQ